MARFAQEFQGYELYDEGEGYSRSVPDGLSGNLAEVLSRFAAADEVATAPRLRSVANELRAMAESSSTTNWDAEALRTDIESAYHVLADLPFDRFMDATCNAAQRLYKELPAAARSDLVREINEVLSRARFGYILREAASAERLCWEATYSAAQKSAASLSTASNALKDISAEAIEHLEQAKKHLLASSNPRSRKDAVRDAMSAMESMVKKLASENDFDKALKKLRAEKAWGNKQIVKEGHVIWQALHELYPDIRHGQQTSSELEPEESVYWIGRISVYMQYMAARKRILGR